MLPTTYAATEMKVAYYIIVVPGFVKTASFISFIGFIITMPLYYLLRLRKTAQLTFGADGINIEGKNINIQVPKERIVKFYCNDLKAFDDLPRDILQIQILQKCNIRTTFRLKHYVQAERFMEQLARFENAEFAFYDKATVEADDDE